MATLRLFYETIEGNEQEIYKGECTGELLFIASQFEHNTKFDSLAREIITEIISPADANEIIKFLEPNKNNL